MRPGRPLRARGGRQPSCNPRRGGDSMNNDVRRNPALLKLDLYCKGMRLDDSCLVEEDGGRKVMRTRAGLGSGLELLLPGGLWTNVPVSEAFAQRSPYVLRRRK